MLCSLITGAASAQIPLTPVIGVNPPLLDFGSVPIGEALEAAVSISNQVSDPASELVVTALEATGSGFSIGEAPPLPITIPGDGTTVSVEIRFAPESLGPTGGVLEVIGEAANSRVVVPLSGLGILTTVPISISTTWNFAPESLSFAPRDTFEIATLEGLTTVLTDHTRAGLPSVPVQTAQVLMPRDRRIAGVTIAATPEPQGLTQHLLYPVQPEGTTDGEPQPDFVPPDPAAYSSPVPYPSKLIEVTNESWYRGYRLATVSIYPLQFVGATTTVILNTQISATFLLEPMSAEDLGQMAPKLRPDYKAGFRDRTRRSVAGRVVNPEALGAFYGEPAPLDGESPAAGGRAYGGFTPSEQPSLDSPPVEYVIVTAEAFVEPFERLADWKTRSGIPAVIRTVGWIDERYAGLDIQERIRNFIRDAYSKWGTNYVLLGGDTEVVPDRFFYGIGSFADPPVDYYYAQLDGNWDPNGDGVFGGVGDFDLDFVHEVIVARTPVNTPAEADVFVEKVLTYSRAPGSAETEGSHYNSLLLAAGLTRSYAIDTPANGIWTAETMENMVSAKAIQVGTPPPAVHRLYENVLLDEDGPCEGTDGDTCEGGQVCPSAGLAPLRDFLCSGADADSVFAQSRRNRLNEEGVLEELSRDTDTSTTTSTRRWIALGAPPTSRGRGHVASTSPRTRDRPREAWSRASTADTSTASSTPKAATRTRSTRTRSARR